jgi:hypothetical protein
MVVKTQIAQCPTCGGPLARGFAVKAAGLSFVRPQKFKKFAFIDEDLQGAGLTKLLPARARFCPSFLCRACRIYVVDYGTTLTRREATEAVQPARFLKTSCPQ